MRTFLLLLVFISTASLAQKEGVEVQKSRLLLLPASTVEKSAGQQYQQLMRSAAQKGLLNKDPEQLERLRRIARELIPHALRFNRSAEKWQWEVNLISSRSVNASCMPGGKIAFFTGILESLELTDDEVATIMGHEIGHALLEHGRARMSAQVLKSVGISVAAAVAVWQKMSRFAQSNTQAGGRGQPPQFLSTHPSHDSRIKEIEANLPKVLPFYRRTNP